MRVIVGILLGLFLVPVAEADTQLREKRYRDAEKCGKVMMSRIARKRARTDYDPEIQWPKRCHSTRLPEGYYATETTDGGTWVWQTVFDVKGKPLGANKIALIQPPPKEGTFNPTPTRTEVWEDGEMVGSLELTVIDKPEEKETLQ